MDDKCIYVELKANMKIDMCWVCDLILFVGKSVGDDEVWNFNIGWNSIEQTLS